MNRSFVPTQQGQVVEPMLEVRLVGLAAFELEGALVVAEQVAQDLDPRVVDQLAEYLAVPHSALLETVGLKEGAFRRHKKNGLALERGVSDRIYRIARVGAAAVDYFEGSSASAGHWLLHPALDLGGRIPLATARRRAAITRSGCCYERRTAFPADAVQSVGPSSVRHRSIRMLDSHPCC